MPVAEQSQEGPWAKENGSAQPKGCQGQGVYTVNHGYNGLSYLFTKWDIFPDYKNIAL